jgi:hypothetical protein
MAPRQRISSMPSMDVAGKSATCENFVIDEVFCWNYDEQRRISQFKFQPSASESANYAAKMCSRRARFI